MSLILQESLRAVFCAPYYAALSLGAYAEEGIEGDCCLFPGHRQIDTCRPIWGQDYRMPEAGYERLVRRLLPCRFVPSGVPFTIAVDNSIANEVLHANPPALVRCESLRMRTLRAPIHEQSRGAMAMETGESVL